jgi:hypothetical protein
VKIGIHRYDYSVMTMIERISSHEKNAGRRILRSIVWR